MKIDDKLKQNRQIKLGQNKQTSDFGPVNDLRAIVAMVSFTSLIHPRRQVRGESDMSGLPPGSLKTGCHDLTAA